MDHSLLTIANTHVYTAASALIDRHGEDAVMEAASRADASQRIGNVERFSHWRQVERAVQILQLEDVVGSIN